MGNSWDRARIVKTVAAILVLGFIALVGSFSFALHRNPFQILTLQLTPSPEELFQKNNILVLVEGLDYDYTNKDEEYSTNSRSDVIWAVNLDFTDKRVYQLSIPRDMVATLPNGTQAKINQAQSDGGVREAQSVISKWLGIPGFDRYMVLRADTTKDLIAALGGVDVNVMNSDCISTPKNCTNGPLDYVDTWGHLNIHLKPGMQHLNGEEAVGYMRFRHDWCGDPCRIKRQQEVLHALMQRLTADKVNTLMHAGDLLGVLNRDVQTNLTRPEEESLVQAFMGMPKNALQTQQVPYVAETYLPNYGDAIVPDTAARAKLVHDMLLDPPRPSPAPDTQAVAAVDPKSVRVEVQNGSGIAGVAKRVAALLSKQGFTIASVGNAPRSDLAASEVHTHSNIQYAGVRVKQALGKNAAGITIVNDPTSPASPSDVTVIVGQDLASRLALQTVTQ
ncbi:MAG TPA: LCP family protein [Candidatus Baltobacteraceae bacterium]|nr:LCP family protein [Candidatus Baltobacteraceae bacterium]